MKNPITPLPWVIDDGFVRNEDMAEQLANPDSDAWTAIGVNDEDGYAASVAYAHPDNAGFIVKACNSHAKLISILERVKRILFVYGSGNVRHFDETTGEPITAIAKEICTILLEEKSE